jgi:tRNA-specific 2-thiouridylase
MKILAAMSGGVDSSVAAALMVEEGHEVIGVTLKQWEDADGSLPTAGCCTVADAEDARKVAAQLDVPYYVLDYVAEFRRSVVDRFGADYLSGITPNPCIECNRTVRFSALLDRATELGCDVLITGHHARVDFYEGRFRLLSGRDAQKDQSYVLHMLGQHELARIRLPIGELTKAEVRDRATAMGLRTAAKADSQDICFVGDGDYRRFLREHFPEASRPGSIVDTSGESIGTHEGTTGFTIGQRRGLGVAVGERRYVVDIDPASALVVIGTREDLLVGGCRVEEVTFVSGRPPRKPVASVKVRYRSRPVPARLEINGSDCEVSFDEPQEAAAPGQSAVFYDGDEVIGGGTIVEAVGR